MDQGQKQESQLPLLRQHHKVLVYNPLPTDFTWPFARTISHLDDRYKDPYIDSLKMRNTDHPTNSHVKQFITIKAGQKYYLPGDAAQVYVKHLIDEVLDSRGQKTLRGNPDSRLAVEMEVMPEFEDLRKKVSLTSAKDQFEQQLRDLNAEPSEDTAPSPSTQSEAAFPELNQELHNESEPAFPSVIPKRGRKPAVPAS